MDILVSCAGVALAWKLKGSAEIFLDSFSTRRGTQLWVTRHVAPKRPYFFLLAFTERPPFLPTFTQCPPVFNKLFVTERPWHIFVTQRPLIFAFNSQTSDNFWLKIGFLEKFDEFEEMLRNYWPIFLRISLKDPLFCALCHWKTPFLTQFVTERSLHLRCLVALIRHFHMWVPLHPWASVLQKLNLRGLMRFQGVQLKIQWSDRLIWQS